MLQAALKAKAAVLTRKVMDILTCTLAILWAEPGSHRDIQQEQQHTAEELADVLGQLAHHARSFLSRLTQAHQELCCKLPDALWKLR